MILFILFPGLFLRRVRLFFDKLSFSQTVGMYKAFQNYILAKKKLIHLTEGLQEELNGLSAKVPENQHSMDIEISSIHEDSSLMNFSDRIMPKELIKPFNLFASFILLLKIF